MRGYRPCGACRALVWEESGCRHWKPMLNRAAQVPEGRAARNRRYQQSARDRAALAVAEFRRMMNRPVTG
jgi:hypothetical protein